MAGRTCTSLACPRPINNEGQVLAQQDLDFRCPGSFPNTTSRRVRTTRSLARLHRAHFRGESGQHTLLRLKPHGGESNAPYPISRPKPFSSPFMFSRSDTYACHELLCHRKLQDPACCRYRSRQNQLLALMAHLRCMER